MKVNAQHMIVYRQPTRFAGWPANYGIWSWGDEIVVGFTRGFMDQDEKFHRRDTQRPFTTMQARSQNGGETWTAKPMPCQVPHGRALSADEHQAPPLQLGPILDKAADLPICPGDYNFTHPDFALMCGRTGLAAGAVSWFYLSQDRCQTWDGPFRLPLFDQPGIAARTDYLVTGPQSCRLFLTAAKSDGREGRVFCAQTEDGGQTFHFLSWIGPEPNGYSIMPATVRLSDTSLVTAVRRSEQINHTRRCWIELYHAKDGGTSWQMHNPSVTETGQYGNPPALIQLRDGRFCLTYGYREQPCGIRARLSTDEGLTWSQEIILRDDAGDSDIGYPRTVQRADGKVVTIYYYNDAPEKERYIAATIWSL